MSSKTTGNKRTVITLTLTASLIYAINCGIRSNYGILLNPIVQNSGVSYSSVSFIIAMAQLTYGIMQPVFGAAALKKTNQFVLKCGVIMSAAGIISIPFCKSFVLLLASLGILLPSGFAALAFGIVMGTITPGLPKNRTATVSGIVTASAGLGSTVFSPLIQFLTVAAGLAGCMLFIGIPTLILLPVSILMCRNGDTEAAAADDDLPVPEKNDIRKMVRNAFADHDYVCIFFGFFTCGFHMAIIETHLFTQITTYGFSAGFTSIAFSAYGVAAMIGAVLSGILCDHIKMGHVLAALYGSRTIMVAAFLVLPKNALTIYAFLILLGLTGNATVPPTSGLTSNLFGAAKLGTLFGLAFLAHQIGSFFSAWFGGICVTATGTYTLIWLVDIVLCTAASIVCTRIRNTGNISKY
jgi:Arabinose efflux permease